MGKSKTKSRSGSGKDLLHSTSAHIKSAGRSKLQSRPMADLFDEATSFLAQSQPELAFPYANEALRRLEAEREQSIDIEHLLKQAAEGKPTYPEVLVLNAQISESMGQIEDAQVFYSKAVAADPHGALISAEPWLWLAQLCDEGGKISITHFEKAIEVLRNELEVLTDGLEDLRGQDRDETQLYVDDKTAKIADALCAMAEVYMTDLSWEDDAEAKCEKFVTEAIATCPERLSARPFQTLANVRISQERIGEAREALARSMIIWKDIPEEVEDSARPDFATRISLARLLMEVEAEPEAMLVIDGLAREDDQSVENVYLGGWCQFLLSQKEDITADDKRKHQEQARTWLKNCLTLYKIQGYEDDRLQDHATELVQALDEALGTADDEDDEEWEDEDDDDVNDDDELLENDGDGARQLRNGDVEMT